MTRAEQILEMIDARHRKRTAGDIAHPDHKSKLMKRENTKTRWSKDAKQERPYSDSEKNIRDKQGPDRKRKASDKDIKYRKKHGRWPWQDEN